MKTPKIKRYRLGVSRNFPTTHPRKGEPTWFVENIIAGQIDKNDNFQFNVSCEYDTGIVFDCRNPKIHTIRSNYELWAKRMVEVQAGKAVIELFYWSGKPYHKDENGVGQVVFATLDKNSGCGVQELGFSVCGTGVNLIDNPFIFTDLFPKNISVLDLCKNDTLSLEDFKAWFKGYDLSQSMAIIQFTSFRY